VRTLFAAGRGEARPCERRLRLLGPDPRAAAGSRRCGSPVAGDGGAAVDEHCSHAHGCAGHRRDARERALPAAGHLRTDCSTGGGLGCARSLPQRISEPTAGPAPFGIGSRDAWTGAAIVAFPIALTWIHDSCAFFVGRRFGRRKLVPAVSPGKTVEGAIGGLVGTVLIGLGYAALVLDRWLALPFSPAWRAAAGVLISIVAQIGDLVESLLKRAARVKASGRIFPGHGGILDRFDALFFTLPVMYWYLSVVVAALGGAPWR